MQSSPKMRWLVLVCAFGLTASALCGCAVSREAQLTRKAASVSAQLKAEQARALRLPSASAARTQRLEHLDSLHSWLSAANVSRGQVKSIAGSLGLRTLAYDLLDEAYETIEWNIPLTRSDPLRSMPRGLHLDGSMMLDGGRMIVPGTQSHESTTLFPAITPSILQQPR